MLSCPRTRGNCADMVKPLELNPGKWWRFSAYRVVDGCVVPAPGARLQEYNPRLDHGVKVKKPSRPYVELCEVLRQLGLADTQYAEDLPSCFPLQDQGQDALLCWCSTYGLLGILLHQVSVVHLAPVWRRVKRDAVIDFPSYARMGDQWVKQAIAHWGEPPVRPRVKVGDPVARQRGPRSGARTSFSASLAAAPFSSRNRSPKLGRGSSPPSRRTRSRLIRIPGLSATVSGRCTQNVSTISSGQRFFFVSLSSHSRPAAGRTCCSSGKAGPPSTH